MSIILPSQKSIRSQIQKNDLQQSQPQDTFTLKQKMKNLQEEIESLQKLKSNNLNTLRKSIKSSKEKSGLPIDQSQKSNQMDQMSSSKVSQNFKNNKVGDLVSELSFNEEPKRKRKQSWTKTVYTEKKSAPNFQQTFDAIDIQEKKKKRILAKIFQQKAMNQHVESNIYNLTIAEIMTGQHSFKENQKDKMIKEIRELKDMVKEISVQNEETQRKIIQIQKHTYSNQNVSELSLPSDSFNLPNQQRTFRRTSQQKPFKNNQTLNLPLAQNTQRTYYTQNTQLYPFESEENTFRSQMMETGKIYKRSRQSQKNEIQELMINAKADKNQIHSIQLRRNNNPYTWNPEISLTLDQKHFSIKQNAIRSGKIYNSIEIKKKHQRSKEKKQQQKMHQQKKKPQFHIMKKKKLQILKKESRTIQMQTQTQSQNKQLKQPQIPLKSNKQYKKQEERFAQTKINRFKQNQQTPKDLMPNFREYVNQKILHVTLPKPPKLQDAQSDLYELGLIIFQLFDIYVDEEIKNKGTEYKVIKYKNCVLFRLNEEKNILWYFDGKFYYGGWEINLIGQGKKQGFGFQIIPQSHVYQGFFKNSKKNGYGIILYNSTGDKNNTIYDGQWDQGLKHGKGYLIENQIQYLGDFRLGIQTGFCKIKNNQTFYQGQIKESIKQGKGREVLKNGDQYWGDFKKNMFDGSGQYRWKSGAYFYGSFVQGKREGQGIWISNLDSQSFDIYKGSYQENKKHGYGIYRWANGTIYQGYFKKDLRHEEGLMIFPNGKAAKFVWSEGNKLKKLYSEQEEIYRCTRNSKTKMKIQGNNQQTVAETVIPNRLWFLDQVLKQLNDSNLVLYKKKSKPFQQAKSSQQDKQKIS